MFSQKRKFKNKKGLTLSAVYEGKEENSPVVVLCHGYASGKDSESTDDLARKLLSNGLNVYRFDFTGCGQSQGNLDDLTPLQGQDDLESAVHDLEKKAFGLYGASFGGYTSLIYASKNPVLALGLKAPVSDYPAVMSAKGNEKENKALDFNKEVSNFDIYRLAPKIKAPTLIVHGSDDTDVPLAQSQELLKSLGGEKRLAIIHKGTHKMRGPIMEDAHNQLAEFFVNKLL